MATQVVILAAGQGKRMFSAEPKVLQRLAGKYLLQHVIEVAETVSTRAPIVIYGHLGHKLLAAFAAYNICWVEQQEQLGTGHALMQALPHIALDDHVLVLCGDVPLISAMNLQQLISATPNNAVGMLTATLANPTGYGRVKRDANNAVIAIVEEKDASAEERLIREINPSVYYIPAKYLQTWLPKLQNQNAQREYYLTDIIKLAKQENVPIATVSVLKSEEISGVNDRMQLAQLERFYQQEQAEKLMRQGVTLIDPARFDVRGTVTVGKDVVIDINVILEGNVILGDGCEIGANCILSNVELKERVIVKPNSMIDGAKIAAECVIGPFARIRPDTFLAEGVHVGNFVEIKNSKIGANTKANHLSYLGDSDIGQRVNVGAGTITCNYDGAHKHKTVIGDDVQIGSDTQLVAPVTIGHGATLGAGSTITKDVPAEQLTITTNLKQRTVDGWQRPVKQKK